MNPNDPRPAQPVALPAEELWPVFATEADAQAGVAAVNAVEGFPVSDTAITRTWDTPRQTADGRWTFARPLDRAIAPLLTMPGVTWEDPADWFPPPPDPIKAAKPAR